MYVYICFYRYKSLIFYKRLFAFFSFKSAKKIILTFSLISLSGTNSTAFYLYILYSLPGL